ncbi:MAG TPA: dicarboxylate/amino acid:cation symporter [Verrucomicrobia bacterium]|nr:dicarboxylate/amino acid:cation symporter [Verrucomicrobiota bacterium]
MKAKRAIIWTLALVVGAVLGSLGIGGLDRFMDFVAAAYTRAFQFVAVPTVALAILTAMASLGEGKKMGRVFARTLGYTVFTSFVAALVGLGLYLLVKPGELSADVIASVSDAAKGTVSRLAETPDTIYGHILNAIPNNLVNPFLTGNVLPIVIISAGIGIAIAILGRTSENVRLLHRAINGLQEIFFGLIKGLIWALPVGIVAFAAQLAAQMSAGVVVGSIGKYVLVVLAGNLIQFFVILPLICYLRGVNGYRVMREMTPALLMALFTKSSAATLPVTIATAEKNMKAKPWIARFILPLCCTINMNGCAAFILVTSLFVMQNSPDCGIVLTLPTMLVWCAIAVICAIGNAGVPMGCYFLTLSLMAGIGGNLMILGVILPIYTIIDMIETAENVWSDCCICSIVDKSTPEAEA